MRSLLLALLCSALMPQSFAAVILQYHHVSNDTPASTSIAPELFARHMAIIEETGFTVIALTELVQMLRDGKEVPDDVVVITFDDAYEDILPAIESQVHSRGWPVTIFVAPQLIESETHGYLSWEQLQHLQTLGADIANHSWAHGHLAERFDGEAWGDWRRRIEASIDDAEVLIKERVGQNLKMLAYPYGEYSAELKSLLAARDFSAVGQQSGAVGVHSDILALPRFPMGGHYGQESDFRMKLHALAMPVTHLSLTHQGKETQHIVKHKAGWPVMTISLTDERFPRTNQITCFATGIGKIDVSVIDDHSFSTQASGEMPLGRSRYNCTAPSLSSGRYYWFSQPFVHLDQNNTWPPEP